jgi:rhamnogalacturonan endolyase
VKICATCLATSLPPGTEQNANGVDNIRFHTPGALNATYKLITGADSTGSKYGGAVMSEIFPSNGQVMEQYWFLKEGETGIHTFSRITYPKDPKGPTRKVLQEFRTLFRPNSPIWTHLSTNEKLASHTPKRESLAKGSVIQDAAYDLGTVKEEPYLKEMGPYFTKYTFADVWQDHVVHGMYGDGSGTPDGTTFGAWMVMNTRDTYYGGPLHSDLTVDGIVYNYMGKRFPPTDSQSVHAHDEYSLKPPRRNSP